MEIDALATIPEEYRERFPKLGPVVARKDLRKRIKTSANKIIMVVLELTDLGDEFSPST